MARISAFNAAEDNLPYFITSFIEALNYNNSFLSLDIDRTTPLMGDRAGLFPGVVHQWDGLHERLSLNFQLNTDHFDFRLYADDLSFSDDSEDAVLFSGNVLSFTLSVDNQIIHTSRCFGLYKAYGSSWESKDDVPMFYKDYDDISANLLRDLDLDYSKIRDKIKSLYPEKNYEYMLDYLSLERLTYNSCNTDIRESFVTSETLAAIHTPVVKRVDGLWELDRNHRFFLDDIYYGNCIAKWIAEQMKIETPTIDAILRWAQEIRGERIIDENNALQIEGKDLSAPLKSGIPCYYGFCSINDLID